MRRLYHGRHFIVTDVGACACQLNKAHLVEYVQAVQVILMKNDLQVLAILLEINRLQFTCLIVGSYIVIEREVTQAREAYVGVVGGHQVGGT